MIAIVGAGPVGSYLAYLLAKNGKEVAVFEEHSKIGLPVQCTGIVTSALASILPIRKQFVVNKVGRAKIFSPSGRNIEIQLRRKNIVLDRVRFDRYLAEKAQDAGAKFFLNQKFLGCSFNKKIKLKFSKKEIETDILVGADGPSSQVAKSTNLFGKRKFVIGLQARISLNLDPDLVEFYLDKNYFGWVVPESSTVARLGIATMSRPNFFFKQFLKKRAGKAKVREYQSGLISIYNQKLKTQKDRVFLLGDAATQVKATTYGGIIHGLMAAQELSKAILTRKFDYEKRWRKRLGKDLKYSLLIRKALNRFSNKDYDYLLKLANKKRVKNLLSRYDRDFPSRFLLKMVLREPRFLKFLWKI